MTKRRRGTKGVPAAVLAAAVAVAVGGALLVTLDGDAAWVRGVFLSRNSPPADDVLLPEGILGPHAGERRRHAREAELVGRHDAGPVRERPRVKPADLARSGRWVTSHLALLAARAASPDRPILDILNEAYCRARHPVTRQNLVFQMALAVRPEQSVPWLRAVGRGQGADADDAWSALAFLGDGEGCAHYVRLADEPETWSEDETIQSSRHHDEVGGRNDEAARSLLRPYRALEVLLRRTYFSAPQAVSRGWVPADRPDPTALVDLLQVWLRRYPGHPGSDDVALYIARSHARDGRVMEAARWYARSCTTGDADAAEESMRGLLGCVELLLGEHEIAGVLHGVEGAHQLEDLLEYVRIRRRAASGDLAGALADVEAHASRRPDSIFGFAWQTRWQARPTQGLDSGPKPLPADDPLRATEPVTERPVEPPWMSRVGQYRGTYPLFRYGQVRPGPLPVMLPWPAAFAGQLRDWETLHELQRRAGRARGAEEAALRYQIAAVCYHEPEIFFPAYAKRGDWFGALLGGGVLGTLLPDDDAWPAAFRRMEQESNGEWRAAQIFAELAAEYPDSKVGEKSSFSHGQALRRFVAHAGPNPGLREDAIRGIFRAFEEFLRDYPDSSMADDAQRALAFWQDKQPHLR